MTALTRDQLRQLPKAELHCHLDGSVRASTLLELGREYGVPMPAATPEALAHHMWVKDARHLEDYLTRFDVTLAVMQRADALERVMYELLEDAHAEGVRYIEVRYSPVLNTRGGLTLDEAVEAPKSLDLAKLAVAHAGKGVVGFDLAGGEAGHPATAHAAAFKHAHRHGLSCTCHAGEGAGADSIREAVHVCGAQRIGHGTRLAEDPRLMDEIGEKGIAIEACLTSNVQTRAAADYASHPVRTYIDHGLTVTLSTDNRLMSRTTLTDEYEHAMTAFALDTDAVCAIARAGFASAFLPEGERRALVAAADVEFSRFRHSLAVPA